MRFAYLFALIASFALALQHGAFASCPSCPSGPVLTANTPLAGGVIGYQGYPLIAVNPINPLSMVAAAISSQGASRQCAVNSPPLIDVSASAELYGSKDNGNTWVARCAPWHPFIAGGVPEADTWYE